MKNMNNDLISRQDAIDAINHICPVDTEYDCTLLDRVDVRCVLSDLPSVQPKDYECWGCNCKKMEAQLSEEDATKDATSDCISRQAVINEMKDMYTAAEEWAEGAHDDDTKARAESCMATNVELKLRIEKLPSVQPQRMMGKWKQADKDEPYVVQCSVCRYMTDNESNFCPNCGADMRGGQDE